MTTVTPSRISAGSWKHRDLPPPVGMIASVLQPVATVWTISSCPGRNASNPKTSRRSVAALGMGPVRFDYICSRTGFFILMLEGQDPASVKRRRVVDQHDPQRVDPDQHHQRREIDAAHVRQDAAHRGIERLQQTVEAVPDRAPPIAGAGSAPGKLISHDMMTCAMMKNHSTSSSSIRIWNSDCMVARSLVELPNSYAGGRAKRKPDARSRLTASPPPAKPAPHPAERPCIPSSDCSGSSGGIATTRRCR